MSNRLDHFDIPDLLGRTDTIDRINAIGPIGRLDGREGELEVPSGPSLIPAAPEFPGVSFAQFIPANLFLGGVLELNAPIDSLPLYGDLIPGGAFTAAGAARPILQEVEGHIGAYHNGARLLAITGLSLAITSGHTFFCVKKDESTGNFQGCARFQRDVIDGANNSNFEFYNASGGQYAVTNRAAGVGSFVAGVNQRPRNSFFVLGADASDPEFAERGIYIDGVRFTTFGSTAPRMLSPTTAIQIAGYNTGLFRGNLETWGIYNGRLNATKRDTLRDYLRDNFNGGEPFEEPEP